MKEKEKRRETFRYNNVPKQQTFTYDGCSVVFYQDTERDDPVKTFHSYLGGDLYNTRAYPPKHIEKFYACDIYGNYIPISMVLEKRRLAKELKELKRKCEFSTTLKVFGSHLLMA